jgi:hypothetical protein
LVQTFASLVFIHILSQDASCPAFIVFDRPPVADTTQNIPLEESGKTTIERIQIRAKALLS